MSDIRAYVTQGVVDTPHTRAVARTPWRPVSAILGATLSVLLLSALSVLGATPPAPAPQDAGRGGATVWTTAVALAPGFGFWVRPGEVGGTAPLGATSRYKTSAVGSGTLTWVADLPQAGDYHVWVRHFGNPATRVLINERPVTGGRGGAPAGGAYVWWHLGAVAVAKGPSHVNIAVEQAALDAVLFTRDSTLDPGTATLPEPVGKPVLRAPRRYRDDAHLEAAAGAAGLVAGRLRDPYLEHCNDVVPAVDELLHALALWGSPNQYVTGTFCVRALEAADEVEVSLPRLVGRKQRLSAGNLDLRVAQLRERGISAHSEHTALSGTGLVPDLLLRDDRTAFPPTGRQGGFGGGRCVTGIPAHESRQIWVTVQIPADCPPGSFRGELCLLVKGQRKRSLTIPVVLDVLALDLQPVTGYFGSFYRASIEPGTKGALSARQFLADLRLHVRYGLNAVTLYDGAPMIRYAREAGMTQPPVSMRPRTTGAHGSWEDEALRQVAAAKVLGFPDLYFYGVDEPHSDEAIAQARTAGQRASEIGLHAQESFMGPDDYEKLKDVTNRPVLMTYNFNIGSTRNELVQQARNQGFEPVSYWFSDSSCPLKSRALVGLYNTACGYHGAAPWATQDYGSEGPTTGYFYHYPDAAGEPIPTLRFEALRHGIDDVRYLQALDRAIAGAQNGLAGASADGRLQQALQAGRQVRRERFESISGGYVAYISGTSAGALDDCRLALAEATVALEAARLPAEQR